MVFTNFEDISLNMKSIFSFLSFAPTEAWNKGDNILLANKQSRGKYNNNKWEYQKSYFYTPEILFEEKLEEFLAMLFPHRDRLIDIKTSNNMQFELRIYYSQEDIHDGFTLDIRIQAKLLALGLDLSIYPQSRKLLKKNLDSHSHRVF